MSTTSETHLEDWRIRAALNAAQGGVCVRPKHHFHDFLNPHARKMRSPETAGESFQWFSVQFSARRMRAIPWC